MLMNGLQRMRPVDSRGVDLESPSKTSFASLPSLSSIWLNFHSLKSLCGKFIDKAKEYISTTQVWSTSSLRSDI
jgi:hypothetical protein